MTVFEYIFTVAVLNEYFKERSGTSVSNPAMGEPVTAGASWLIDDFRPCQEEVGEILCGSPGVQSSSQGWCMV